MRFLLILAAVLGLAAPALAQTPTDTRALLAANTRAFELTAEGIKGPGADFLLAQTEPPAVSPNGGTLAEDPVHRRQQGMGG